jgi:hypothetical protein
LNALQRFPFTSMVSLRIEADEAPGVVEQTEV